VSSVLYELRGAAAWVTLNRPEKRNAIDGDMLAGLAAALERALADDEVRVVVLAGAGPAFSAGYDLTDPAQPEAAGADGWHATLTRDVEATMRLWALPKPTIAAVRGHCLAGGCELAMACDMVVSARSGRFGEPEIRFGSGPVTLLMPYVLGQKRTAELLFTGDTIDAEEALRAGLVNRVVADEELEAAVEELARRVALAPPAVLRLTKLALVRAFEAMGLRAAVAANLDLSAILNAADTPEGREFAGIVKSEGLRAALAWRDSRYAEPPGEERA
jgi:enoyl-CoA hydratase